MSNKVVTFKDLIDNAVHFGHKTHKWNPKMKKFIYTERKGIHIFDVHIIARYLAKALDFLATSVSCGKNILFVGTKQYCKPLLEEIQKNTNYPIVSQKWICGLLTNFKTVRKRIFFLKKLIEDEESGEMQKYTKKEQLSLRKQRTKLMESLGGVMNMNDLPDVLFVLDCKRDKNALVEAKKLKIPVIGILDTNADPDLVDYAIPGNDDALKSLRFLLGLVQETILDARGKKEKKEEEEE